MARGPSVGDLQSFPKLDGGFIEMPWRRPAPYLLHCKNLNVAFTPEDLDADVVRMSREQQVQSRVDDRDVSEPNPIDTVRQHRTAEPDATRSGINLDTQAGAEQHECGACRPCLRYARDRIERGRLAAAAMKATD